jgi:hypothetical protein
MKLIDQTPFQNDQGEIGIFQRLQGTLKYGLSWYPELKAQKTVLATIDRILQGFTIIRNHTLDSSGIVLPLIVIGKPGVVIAYVTHLRGTYLAKEDSWRTLRGNSFQDTPINLLTRTERMARALNVFLERQGVKRQLNVDPVILAADPGLFVETQRPLVRVVLNDGLERWANSLVKAPPVMSLMNVEELADRIVHPKKLRRKTTPEAEFQPAEAGSQTVEADLLPVETEPAAGPELEPTSSSFDDELEPSRAQAIFRAAEEAESLDPNDLGFAFAEEEPGLEGAPEPSVASAETPFPSSSGKKGMFGMSRRQLMILGGILLLEICILAGFAAMYLFYF